MTGDYCAGLERLHCVEGSNPFMAPLLIERLWRCLLAHHLDHLRSRDKPGTRKSLQDCTGAKEVIAVAMGGVDRRQILSAREDPIRQCARLLDGNRCVD